MCATKELQCTGLFDYEVLIHHYSTLISGVFYCLKLNKLFQSEIKCFNMTQKNNFIQFISIIVTGMIFHKTCTELTLAC